jgi:hypothetical protein
VLALHLVLHQRARTRTRGCRTCIATYSHVCQLIRPGKVGLDARLETVWRINHSSRSTASQATKFLLRNLTAGGQYLSLLRSDKRSQKMRKRASASASGKRPEKSWRILSLKSGYLTSRPQIIQAAQARSQGQHNNVLDGNQEVVFKLKHITDNSLERPFPLLKHLPSTRQVDVRELGQMVSPKRNKPLHIFHCHFCVILTS